MTHDRMGGSVRGKEGKGMRDDESAKRLLRLGGSKG